MTLPALRLLAIESSTDTLSVAVGSGLPDVAPHVFSGPGAAQASATLLPAVQALLDRAGWPLTSLDAVVFGRGPGSFTGLRTACSVAQGLAYGAQGAGRQGELPVLPVDTLLALAEVARERHRAEGGLPPAAVAALLDARMDEIYVAVYPCRDGALGVAPLRAPCLCAPEDLPGVLDEVWSGGPCLLAGNVFEVYRDRLQALKGPRQPCLPQADALLALAPRLLAAGHAVVAHDALPLYVRDKVALTTAERENR